MNIEKVFKKIILNKSNNLVDILKFKFTDFFNETIYSLLEKEYCCKVDISNDKILEIFTNIFESKFNAEIYCYGKSNFNDFKDNSKQFVIAKTEIDQFKLYMNNFSFEQKDMHYCIEHSKTDHYFLLKKTYMLHPNYSMVQLAVSNDLLDIVKDIETKIDINISLMEIAFTNSATNVGKYLVDRFNKIYKNETINYLFMTSNIELLEYLKQKKLLKIKNEYYFSAILSGNLDVIRYFENLAPDIHYNLKLDLPKSKKKTAIQLEFNYIYNNQNYCSNIMNYSVLSENIDIIKYHLNIGYQLTRSNIINSIKTGNLEVVKFLITKYLNGFDESIYNYFGTNVFFQNKMEILQIIIPKIFSSKKTIRNKIINNFHKDHADRSDQILEKNTYDLDFLLSRYTFLKSDKQDIYMRFLLSNNICPEKQHINNCIDTFYYFCGNKMIPLISACPKIEVLLESLAEGNKLKLFHLINKNLLNSEYIQKIWEYIQITNDFNLFQIYKIKYNKNPDINFCCFSRNSKMILDSYNENNPPNQTTVKILIMMDDTEINEKFKKYLLLI